MSGILMAPVYGGAGAFVFAPTISADVSNYNLRAEAIAAGWNGTSPLTATVTIASGVVVSANSTSAYAFDTGTGFPTGSTLALVNNGYVIGMGGAGGSASYAYWLGCKGGPGGAALLAQAPIAVTNNGTIGGGGGGGNGGVHPEISVGGGGGGRSGRTSSAGGSPYNGGPAGQAGTFAAAGYGIYDGSYGGDWGADGVGTTSAGFAGPAGPAVVGNSNITWLATGTRMGALT